MTRIREEEECLNQKQCSKWPPPALTHAEIRDAMMHSSSNDNPLSSYAVLEVVEISHACTPCLAVFPTHLSQLDLNLANLKATVEVEWFWHFPSDCENEIFKFNDVTFTSSLCSVVQVLKGHFTPFTQFVKMIHTKNYKKNCLNLSKLWPKYCWSILTGHTVYVLCCLQAECLNAPAIVPWRESSWNIRSWGAFHPCESSMEWKFVDFSLLGSK